jgi:hypothetical protein
MEKSILAERNLTVAANQESFQAIEAVIAELKRREGALVTELKSAESRSDVSADPNEEIEAALSFAERLSELASSGENFALARETFAVADAKLFVKFKPVAKNGAQQTRSVAALSPSGRPLRSRSAPVPVGPPRSGDCRCHPEVRKRNRPDQAAEGSRCQCQKPDTLHGNGGFSNTA